MKTFLKVSLVVFLAFTFTHLNAQVKSGFIFGINLSTMTINVPGLSSNPTTPVGIHFGRIFEIPLSRHISFQPAFLFSAKGSDYKIDTSNISISPIYIEIPVNALFCFGSEAFKVFIYAGPYFAFGMGGYKIESGAPLKDIKWGSKGNDDLKPFDVGLNFGAGINIKGFLISGQYGLGLANLSPVTSDNSEIKNKVIGISISSVFARR
jgi:hypothetical protein